MSVNHCWATGISRLIGIHPSVLVVPQHVGDYPVAAGIGPGVSLTSATICVVTRSGSSSRQVGAVSSRIQAANAATHDNHHASCVRSNRGTGQTQTLIRHAKKRFWHRPVQKERVRCQHINHALQACLKTPLVFLPTDAPIRTHNDNAIPWRSRESNGLWENCVSISMLVTPSDEGVYVRAVLLVVEADGPTAINVPSLGRERLVPVQRVVCRHENIESTSRLHEQLGCNNQPSR